MTIGSLQAGTKENIIPDEALIKLNVRTFDEGVRKRVLAAIDALRRLRRWHQERQDRQEITPLDQYSSVRNDANATKKLVDALLRSFPAGSSNRRSPLWQARTSAALELGGTFRQCIGSSAGMIQRCTPRQRKKENSARFQPTITPPLHQSFIRLWKPV